MRHHRNDEDCTVNLATSCCAECGVYHSDPCDVCGGRAYHREGCPESKPDNRELAGSRRQMIDTEEIEQENAIWPWLADDSMADDTEGY